MLICLQVNCNGKSTTNQLSGHCSGEVASRLFEVQVLFSELCHQQCTVLRPSSHRVSIGGCCRDRNGSELTRGFVHTFKYLHSFNSIWDMQVKALVKQTLDMHMSMFSLATAGWETYSELEASTQFIFQWYTFASLVHPYTPSVKPIAGTRGLQTRQVQFQR